ncbi:hypothetical protein HPP92_013762 [Vanilla planifolia]|uniref:Uncharacterized protein n=1 Tax=Vanilla planifolia TaxID=51239 RepID=A0A835R322_VANPL|nr:hypothetical protein HPP92_013762 [Vanilla planifolia]
MLLASPRKPRSVPSSYLDLKSDRLHNMADLIDAAEHSPLYSEAGPSSVEDGDAMQRLFVMNSQVKLAVLVKVIGETSSMGWVILIRISVVKHASKESFITGQ